MFYPGVVSPSIPTTKEIVRHSRLGQVILYTDSILRVKPLACRGRRRNGEDEQQKGRSDWRHSLQVGQP